MSKWRMPTDESASTTAFMTEARLPAQPASPQPLAPIGLVVAGEGWLAFAMAGGTSVARGSA